MKCSGMWRPGEIVERSATKTLWHHREILEHRILGFEAGEHRPFSLGTFPCQFLLAARIGAGEEDTGLKRAVSRVIGRHFKNSASVAETAMHGKGG